jgi:hypothetical protein
MAGRASEEPDPSVWLIEGGDRTTDSADPNGSSRAPDRDEAESEWTIPAQGSLENGSPQPRRAKSDRRSARVQTEAVVSLRRQRDELRDRLRDERRVHTAELNVLAGRLREAEAATGRKRIANGSNASRGQLRLAEASFEDLRAAGLTIRQSTRLLAERDTHGIESEEELAALPGFSDATVAKLRGAVSLG